MSFVWIRSKASVKAIAVVVHGLNLKPEKMNSLSEVLNQEGVDVLCLALAGHRDDRTNSLLEMKKVRRLDWLQEFHSAYAEARQESEKRHLPLNFLGYSLGALLGLDAMAGDPTLRFERLILVAPAVGLKIPPFLLKVLGAILGKTFMIGSQNLKDYRAQPGTSLAAYAALASSHRSLPSNCPESFRIPTLVMIDPKDEFVSLKKLRKWIKNKDLQSIWKVVEISSPRSLNEKVRHHLMVDEASVGVQNWALMRAEIARSLRSSKTSEQDA